MVKRSNPPDGAVSDVTKVGTVPSGADSAEALISNAAEAEAYLRGYIDGVLVALRRDTPDQRREISLRCARMRELTEP